MKKFNLIFKANKFFSFFCLTLIFLSIFVISGFLFMRNAGRADAQISSFYPTSCLGGWKNTGKAEDVPDVTAQGDKEYNETNSASISNSVAQIFCGGFKGKIPADSFQKKIVLKFSWAIKGAPFTRTILNTQGAANASDSILVEDVKDDTSSSNGEAPLETETEENLPTESPVLEEETVTPEIDIEPTKEEEMAPISEPVLEPAPAEETSFIYKLFFAKANAEEIVPEEIVPSDAILEVLYTLDGDNWKTIGYVSNITNDVSFKMPMDIFTTIADLERVQIGIRTLPTYDDVPTIYLDSVWLDVEYQKTPVTKGISGFKVFILTQDKLESSLNNWFALQKGIVIDDLKVENYGESGYLVVVSYHSSGFDELTTRFKLVIGENPEADAQTFLSSLDESKTVRSINATTGFYSGPETTIIVPIIFILYE